MFSAKIATLLSAAYSLSGTHCTLFHSATMVAKTQKNKRMQTVAKGTNKPARMTVGRSRGRTGVGDTGKGGKAARGRGWATCQGMGRNIEGGREGEGVWGQGREKADRAMGKGIMGE